MPFVPDTFSAPLAEVARFVQRVRDFWWAWEAGPTKNTGFLVLEGGHPPADSAAGEVPLPRSLEVVADHEGCLLVGLSRSPQSSGDNNRHADARFTQNPGNIAHVCQAIDNRTSKSATHATITAPEHRRSPHRPASKAIAGTLLVCSQKFGRAEETFARLLARAGGEAAALKRLEYKAPAPAPETSGQLKGRSFEAKPSLKHMEDLRIDGYNPPCLPRERCLHSNSSKNSKRNKVAKRETGSDLRQHYRA